ncbi:MAG: hypothetical protein HGA19_23165, partial [Oscillochloris sp.]|nr:hypothetical protein [Oscillochloris sp.]
FRSAEAISHALASDDQRLAAKLINQYADTIIRHGELTTIINWLTALPDTALQAYPRLYLVHAWSLMMSSQFDTAELHLNKAQLILGAQAAGESEQNSSLSGELMVLRGAVAMVHGDSAQARDLLAQADTKLKPDNTIRQSLVMLMFGFQSLAHGDVEGASRTFIEVVMAGLDSEITATMLAAIYGLGYMQILNGNLHEAGYIFEQALQMAHSSGNPLSPMTSLIYLGLSKVRREFNDLAAAYDMAMKSISLGKRWGNTRFVVEAYLVLARIQRAQGALDAALDTTQVAEVTLQQAQNHRWMRSSMLAERVRIWLAKGDTLLAQRWADLYRLKIAKADEHMPPLLFQRDLEELMLVRVLIYPRHQQPSTDALREAQHFLEAFLQRAKQIRSQERVIEATLLLALVWQARGDQQRMFEHLGRALRLAEPSGYIRLFIDEGEPMLQALQRYAHAPETQHGAEAVAPAYLQELITAATGDTSPSSTINARPVRKVNNIGHLSDRELDVLRLIVSGATTDEIAHALTIAPGTVKRHLHSIYSKLDVRNRVQVVERARALRLVP